MPVVSAPVVVLPRHRVTTEELLDRMAELYGDRPEFRAARSLVRGTGVRSRWYSRPLAEQFTESAPVADRMRAHFTECLDLAEYAGREALLEAGLEPTDIDGLVVLSSTGHTTPGLDVQLIRRLGLAPTVSRVPVCQIGCAGGVFGIIRAMELVAARPGARVLVVCADVFSHHLHAADTNLGGMMIKGLFGDAAGACVVRSEADGPSMELASSWEYVQPGTDTVVGSDIAGDGLHGYVRAGLGRVVEETAVHLRRWLEDTAPPDVDPRPAFVVSHTGGPRILDGLVAGLGLRPDQVDLSRDSLRELGNVGSASVLDVLQRTFAKSPADGDHGVLLGLGPGVTMVAVRAVWRALG